MVAKKTLSSFIQDAERKYGVGLYDYSLIASYENNKVKMPIRCTIHDIVFNVASNDFLGKKSVTCPECKKGTNKATLPFKNELSTFLNSLCIPYETNYKHENGITYDFFFVQHSLAIMFSSAILSHSSKSDYVNVKYKSGYVDKNSKYNTTIKSIESNVTCITVFDFYWKIKEKKEVYKSKIKHYLGFDERIYARKTTCITISNKEANEFYDTNHLEGSGFSYKNTQSIGLFDEQERLVMCASFGEIYDQASGKFKHKLQRICTLKGVTVIGGISKLSKAINFIIQTDFSYQIVLSSGASTLTSVSDIRYIEPRYFWVNPITLEYYHRNNTQKGVLEKNFKEPVRDDDTESTYMERLHPGYLKVYDAGLAEIKF